MKKKENGYVLFCQVMRKLFLKAQYEVDKHVFCMKPVFSVFEQAVMFFDYDQDFVTFWNQHAHSLHIV